MLVVGSGAAGSSLLGSGSGSVVGGGSGSSVWVPVVVSSGAGSDSPVGGVSVNSSDMVGIQEIRSKKSSICYDFGIVSGGGWRKDGMGMEG